MNDDPNFFTAISNALGNKQNTLSNGTSITGSESLLNTTTSKIKNIVGTNLTLTADDHNLTIAGPYDKSALDNKFASKQNNFLVADTLPANTSRLFDASETNFRAINVTSPLSIATTNDSYLSISCDSYTKEEVTYKISSLVNSAPALLDTLGEIATYLGNPSDTSTSLITAISNKANTSETFLKSVINNDVYLTVSPNKRIVGTTTANQFKFQILDNQGTTFTDAWIDVGILDFNITTKKAKLTVKDSLFVDTTDIIGTLNNKVNATSLSSYANLTSTTLQTFLGEIKAPIITLGTTSLANTAAGWTSGAPNASHTINVGPMWLSVMTPNNRTAFEVMGSANGLTQEAQTQFFYKVTVPELLVQGGLNTSGNISVSRSDPTGQNVVISAKNTGLNGFSSLYLETANQTINETGQLFVGQQSGLVMMTRTNHPLQFKAYSDQPLTTVPTSMKILSNTTRDVEIYTPLKIKSTTATVIDNGLVVNGVLKVDEIRMTDTETLPSDGVMITAINGRQLFKVSNENTTSSENLVGLKNIEAVANLTVGGTSNFTGAITCGSVTATGVLKVDEIRMTDTETLPSDGVMITAIDGRQLFKVSNTNTTCTENFVGLKNIEAVANLTVGGNLTVTGTTSFASANPYWVAVIINYVGGDPTIIRNGGRYAATSLIRQSGQAVGVIQFDFPEHPNGTNYIVSITANAGYGTVYTASRSSTRFGITTRNISNVLFDTETHVLILAY